MHPRLVILRLKNQHVGALWWTNYAMVTMSLNYLQPVGLFCKHQLIYLQEADVCLIDFSV